MALLPRGFRKLESDKIDLGQQIGQMHTLHRHPSSAAIGKHDSLVERVSLHWKTGGAFSARHGIERVESRWSVLGTTWH